MLESYKIIGGACFFLGAILGCLIINSIVKKFYKGKWSYGISFVVICLICGFSMGENGYVSGMLKGAYNYIFPMIILYFIDKIKTKKNKDK